MNHAKTGRRSVTGKKSNQAAKRSAQRRRTNRQATFEGLEPRNLLAGWTVDPASTSEGSSITFTITLSSTATEDRTFSFQTYNGTADDSSDYSSSWGSVTIGTGYQSGYVGVPTANDYIHEGNETFTLSITELNDSSNGTAIGTIYDDESTPTVSYDAVSSTITEGASAVFGFSLSGLSQTSITAYYKTQFGSADDDDFAPQTGCVVFAPMTSTASVYVATYDDSLDEGDEWFGLNRGDEIDVGWSPMASITIQDNDATPSVFINATTSAGFIEGQSAYFTASLTAVSGMDVTVYYQTAGDNSGPDYVSVTGSVVIPAGESTVGFGIATVNDILDEDDETYSLNVTGATNASLVTSEAPYIILDNDEAPYLTIRNAGLVPEGQSATFHMTLSAPSSKSVTVAYMTVEGIADDSSDYIPASAYSSVIFEPGQTSLSVDIQTLDDAIEEDVEDFYFSVTGLTNASIETSRAYADIVDNEPTIEILDAEPIYDGGTAEFKIVMSPATDHNVTVYYQTQNGTAIAGTNYTAVDDSVVFTPGQTTKTILVETIDDSVQSEDETFSLILESDDAYAAEATGVGTIYRSWPTEEPSGGGGPDVSVFVTWSSSGTEGGGEGSGGSIQFDRSNSYHGIDFPTKVFFSLSGSAEPADFENLQYAGGGRYTITFPAGEGTYVLYLMPKAYDGFEETENLTVTLIATADYRTTPVGISSPNAYYETETVQIVNTGGGFDWSDTCTCTCTCSVNSKRDPAQGGNDTSTPIPGTGMQLKANSKAPDKTVIRQSAKFTSGDITADKIEVYASMGGISTTPVYYDPSTLIAGVPYEFAIPFDGTGLDEDLYEWTLNVIVHDGLTTSPQYFNGKQVIEHTETGPFGKGFVATGLDRLTVTSNGAYAKDASGHRQWFDYDMTNGYTAGINDKAGATIEPGDDDTYILADAFGNVRTYNEFGWIISRVDIDGNTETYNYIDADSDGDADDISEVVDHLGHTTTFGYSTGRVSTITSFNELVTTLDYEDGLLTSIVGPDPDGEGIQDPAETLFDYNEDDQIFSFTAPGGAETSFTYGYAGTLASRINPDEVTEDFSPAYVAGIVDTSGGLGSELDLAPLLASADAVETRVHPDLGTTTIKRDRHGNVLEQTDDDGNTTSYRYDYAGRVIQITTPDPDDIGPLTPDTTKFYYDGQGNQTFVEYPDSTTEEWTYDPELRKPLTYINRLGFETDYTYDESGNVLSVRQIVGEFDGKDNDEVDDVVTRFTYTVAPSEPGDAPVSLVSSITDALQRVTQYVYNAAGLVTQVTYAAGRSVAAFITYDYDENENLIESMDELGRVTTYDYDDVGRLITKTLPDPDGPGMGNPLTSPIYRYEYDAAGRLAKEIDPLDRETIYTYDGSGNLTQIDRPDHDDDTELTTTVYGYNGLGQQTSITDPLGRITTLIYNSLGQLYQQISPDPDGDGIENPLTSPVTTYTYDHWGRALTVTDALENVTTYTYGAYGQEVTVTQPDPDGEGELESPVSVMIYDALGQLISVEDALHRITTYEYDALGRKITMTQPDPTDDAVENPPVTHYEYDKVGNLRFVTDPMGNVTEYVYDARNRLTRTIHPDPDGVGVLKSPVTRSRYDAAGQVTSTIDPLGRVTNYMYDNLGRTIAVIAPMSGGNSLPQVAAATTYAYDAASRLVSTTDALGRVTTYEYDLLDNLVETTLPDPDGGAPLVSPVITSLYDAAGQLLSTTDALENTTTFTYDNLGRQLTVTQPDPDAGGELLAPRTTYTYDAVGNLLTTSDSLNHTTTYVYDNLYRVLSVTDANDAVTEYTYDAVGNRLTLTDPVENMTSWIYDALNRVIDEENELGDHRLFEYDSNGNLLHKTDRLERVTQYVYDHLNRRTAELWKDGVTTIRTLSFAYDAVGQLVSASDPSASYDYTYDQMGRIAQVEADIDGLTPHVILSQSYDAVGNRGSLVATIGSEADFSNLYSYDHLNRLRFITQTNVGGGHAVAQKRIDIVYNANGQVTTLTRYADSNASELVATTTNGYDLANRLTSIAHTKGVTALAGYDYTYDAASRITAIDSLLDDLSQYTLDDTNQLTGAVHTGQTDESHTYDDNGNRIEGSYDIDPNNQIATDGTYNYEYDDEGNRTVKVTIATGLRVEYTWDYRNRLVTVTEKNSGGTVLKSVNQAYDVYNRWVRSTLDSNGAIAGGVSNRFFVYDGNQIVLEFDGTESADLSHRYLWGQDVDQLLTDETVTSLSAAGNVVWPLSDHLGTTRDLATHNSSTHVTAVANHRRFDSFGNVVSESNSAVDIVFGFTGRAYDENTGIQNNLNRWYDPIVGQWMSEDPLGFAGGDLNFKRYVNNSVVFAIDPHGLFQLPMGAQEEGDYIVIPGLTDDHIPISNLDADDLYPDVPGQLVHESVGAEGWYRLENSYKVSRETSGPLSTTFSAKMNARGEPVCVMRTTWRETWRAEYEMVYGKYYSYSPASELPMLRDLLQRAQNRLTIIQAEMAGGALGGTAGLAIIWGTGPALVPKLLGLAIMGGSAVAFIDGWVNIDEARAGVRELQRLIQIVQTNPGFEMFKVSESKPVSKTRTTIRSAEWEFPCDAQFTTHPAPPSKAR